MKLLYTLADGSKLYSMSALALTRIRIWKGQRYIDPIHVKNIKESTKAYLLDSGYKMIQCNEMENGELVKKSYIIDGQHRIAVIKEYFETKTYEDDIFDTSVKDFDVLVTEKTLDNEEDVIKYFNAINNVKPIQYEEEPNLIVNKYLEAFGKEFPGKLKVNRPYLSRDKFREALTLKIDSLKKLSVDDFVRKCKIENDKMIKELKMKEKEKIIERMIQMNFALGWNNKWLDVIC